MKKIGISILVLAIAAILAVSAFSFVSSGTDDAFVYVSDLNETSATVGWKVLRKDVSESGGTIRLQDSEGTKTEFEKGLFAHANSEVVYDIEDCCFDRFTSYIGVEATGGNASSSVTFTVKADGTLLYTSPSIVTLASGYAFVDVEIPEGTKTLTLITGDGNNSNNTDHSVWADAKLHYSDAADNIIKGLSLVCDKTLLESGDEAALSASTLSVSGKTALCTSGVTYTSEDESVATVNSSGEIIAMGAGKTSINAGVTIDGNDYSQSLEITVYDNESDKCWAAISPDESIIIVMLLEDNGSLTYTVQKNGVTVVEPSQIGIVLSDASLTDNFSFESVYTYTTNSTCNAPSGKVSTVSDNGNYTVLSLANGDYGVDLPFAAYNDGFAFRYTISSDAPNITINEETTEFVFPERTTLWAQTIADVSQKFGYETGYPASDISSLEGVNLSMPFISKNPSGIWALITEADLYSQPYTGSILTGIGGRALKVSFAPVAENSVTVESSFTSPWRLGIVGDLETIVESNLVEEISPKTEEDFSWVETGVTSWSWLTESFSGQRDYNTIKEYIDIASEMGWKYLIFDEGWQPNSTVAGKRYDGYFDWFGDIVDYADEKGVGIIVWVLCDDLNTPEEREILTEWANIGIKGIKADFFDSEDNAHMEYLRDIYAKCAENHLVVNCHGTNKPTGERMMYPNVINREAVKGREYGGLWASDATVWAFTRNVVGPMDITPMIANPSGNITAMGQIAQLFAFESGMPCIASAPEDIIASPAYGLLKDMPSSWDEIEYIDGYPAEYTVLARRSGNTWYISGVNNSQRDVEFTLDFLSAGKEYNAVIYKDGISSSDIEAEALTLASESTIDVSMLTYGGFVIKLIPTDETDISGMSFENDTMVAAIGQKVYQRVIFTGETGSVCDYKWSLETDCDGTIDCFGNVKFKEEGSGVVTATSLFDGTSASYTVVASEDGAGSESDPILINNLQDFIALQTTVNGGTGWGNNGANGDSCEGKYYKLTSDIDLTGIDFVPLGYWQAVFSGTLDGGGYTIKGLKASHSAGEYMGGLIGNGVNATVKNLTIDTLKVDGAAYVGGLMGKATDCIIQSVTLKNVTVTAGGDYAGGVIGTGNAVIRNISINNATVTSGKWYVGGIAGKLSGDITGVTLGGAISVTAGGNNVGGLIGYSTGSDISGITAESGSITVTTTDGNDHGGLIGKFENGSLSGVRVKAPISVSTGFSAAGGIIGGAYNITLDDIFVTGSVNVKISYNGAPIIGKVYSGTNSLADVIVAGKCTVTANNSGRVIGEVASGAITNLDTAVSSARLNIVASVSGSVYYGAEKDGNGKYINGMFMSKDGITVADGYTLSKNLEENIWYVTATGFDGGDGSEENPYLIANAQQFRYFRDYVNATTNSGTDGHDCNGLYFRLTGDIDLKGDSWLSIGYWNMSFKGTLDGDGHTISGAVTDHFGGWGLGLFGTLNGATIKNINLENMFAITNTGVYNTGIVAGKANGGTQFIAVNFIGEGSFINAGNNTGYMIGATDDSSAVIKCCYAENLPFTIDKDEVNTSPRMIGNKSSYDKVFGHSYTSTVTTATCTEDGYTTYTCSVCGDSYTGDTITATGHNTVSHSAKAPTCTEIGWAEYNTCSKCDYTTYSEIPALGHNTVTHIAKAATCTESGYNKYVTCTRCDYTTYSEIPATGHKYESVVTPATCTEDGYTTYTCSACGDSYTGDTTTAKGHNFVDGVCTLCGTVDPDYNPIKNGLVEEDGKLYYYVEDVKQSGWFTLDGVTYYALVASKEVVTADKVIGGKQYLWNDETGLTLANGFVETADGTICYYNGIKAIGWRHADGTPITIDENGVYEQYSTNPQGLYYFLSTTGYMVTDETYTLGGYKREFNADHTVKPLNGLQIKGETCRYYADGEMQLGWQEIDGNKYYFLVSTGNAATMWQQIDGKLYYFASPSSAVPFALKTSGTIGGIAYTYGDNGNIVVTGFMNTVCAVSTGNNASPYIHMMDGTTKYYVNGEIQYGWQQIDGNWYYFYVNGSAYGSGYMCVTSRTVGGVAYTFTAQGVCTNKA